MSNAEASAPTSKGRHRVKLGKTASARTTSEDLLNAVIENSQLLGAGSVSSTIRRYSLAAEVSYPDEAASGDSAARERTFVFRKFRRAPDGTVLGGKAPLFNQVTVALNQPILGGNWVAEVTDVTTGRDPEMYDLARLPQAGPGQTRVQARLRAVIPAIEAMPWVEEFGVERPRGGLASPEDPVTVVVRLKTGTEFKLKAQISSRTGHLEVSTPAGRVTFPPIPIRVGAGADRWAVDRALETALIPALGYFVGRQLGYPDVPPNGPCYVPGPDGEPVATAVCYLKLATLHRTNQLLERKSLSKPARIHAHGLRDDIIDELGARAGSPRAAENRALLYSMFPRVKPVIERYGTKRRKSRVLDAPEGVFSLPTHFAIGAIPGQSNLLAALFSPNKAQRYRYTYALLSTSPFRGASRWFLDRNMVREHNDPAPPRVLHPEALAPNLGVGGVGGTIDAGGRALISLWLGGDVDPALLSEIAGRRIAAGIATGISTYASRPRFSPANDLADQAKKVAARGEVVNDFFAVQDELELLLLSVPELLKKHHPSAAEAAELDDLLNRLHGMSRKTWDLFVANGLSSAALRTKAAPLRTPGSKALLKTRAGPSLAGAMAGVGMAPLHPAFGLLGLRSLADTTFNALGTTRYEHDKAEARAQYAKDNQAYRYKTVDDDALAARFAVAKYRGVEADLPESLPKAKRRIPRIRPHVKNALIVSALSSPISAIGYLVPDLYYLALGLLLSGLPSQLSNQGYVYSQEIVEHFLSIRDAARALGIARAEDAPRSLAELRERLESRLTKISQIYDRAQAAVSAADVPMTARDLSVADVFKELKKRGSVHLLERFHRIVKESGGSERRLYRRLRLLVPGYGELKPQKRAAKIAGAIDLAHESNITAVAKLEMMDRCFAERVPAEFRLAAVWPAGLKREIGSQEYIDFARVMQELWFVTDPSDGRRISDVTGRYAAVAWLAAMQNGAARPDSVDPEKQVLDVAAATKLVPAAAALIALDIKRLAGGWSIEDLMTDTPPLAGTERVRSEADAAKHLLAMLGDEEFHERYTGRVSESLADIRRPATDRAEAPAPRTAEAGEIGWIPLVATTDKVAGSLTVTIGEHVWRPEVWEPQPTVAEGVFAGLDTREIWTEPADPVRESYLTRPRTRTGEEPNRSSQVVFSHQDGPYVRHWPAQNPDQPIVVVFRRCGHGADRGRLSYDERSFLEETNGVVIECGLPENYDFVRWDANGEFERNQLTQTLLYAQQLYQNPTIHVVGDPDCQSVISITLSALKRFEDGRPPVADNPLGKSIEWQRSSGWPERARLRFAKVKLEGRSSWYRGESSPPTSEVLGSACTTFLDPLHSRQVWSPPADPIRESYLVKPRTREGVEPGAQSRVLFSRPDGAYVREWSARQADYPVVVVVRRCGTDVGSGRLDPAECSFLSGPKGVVIECGLPDYHDSHQARSRDSDFCIEQVARALAHAQQSHPDSEIALVCDRDCDDVIDDLAARGALDTSRVLYERETGNRARIMGALGPRWPVRVGPMLNEIGQRRFRPRLLQVIGGPKPHTAAGARTQRVGR